MAAKRGGMKDIPGFVYDENRRRYFRVPSRHFASLPQYNQVLPVSSATNVSKTSTSHTLSHNDTTPSIFSVTRRREHCIPLLDLFNRILCDRLMFKLKTVSDIEVDSGFSAGYCISDISINSTGDLLAVSCAKDSPCSQNLLCYKCLHVLQVVTNADGGCFQLEPVSTPIGVIEASSLQHGKGVKVMSSHGCSKIVYPKNNNYYVDRLVEIAKLDKYNLQAGPLKRISKDSMNSLALNPVEDCYSVAIGFESGSIELLTEQSSNSIVLRGYTHDPVLSLAFSAQRALLYAGHRSGRIIIWDYRRLKKLQVMKEEKVKGIPSSIIGIHPLLDHNYFVCSAFNSKLRLWDTRLQKAIVMYSEHINDYKQCPSLVDKTESFLISVGTDACIRVWILYTGVLVRCIRPHECGSSTSYPLPMICYSETFSGKQFNPSLLVIIKNRIVQFNVFY